MIHLSASWFLIILLIVSSHISLISNDAFQCLSNFWALFVFATANDGTNPDIKDLSIGLSTPAGTTGQVQINNSGAFGAVAEGTSGFVLTSNGSGAAPTMQAPAVSVGKAIAMAIVFG